MAECSNPNAEYASCCICEASGIKTCENCPEHKAKIKLPNDYWVCSKECEEEAKRIFDLKPTEEDYDKKYGHGV